MDQSFLTAADLSILHDAELCLVVMDRDAARLRLGFKGVDQLMRTMSFHGVLSHRIDNLIYQNVVSRIRVSDAGLSFDEEIRRVMRWICSSGDDLLISEQTLQDHSTRVRAGGFRLLYVEPSWGAEVGVIAERFYLSDGPE
jgi:hypothetical protein